MTQTSSQVKRREPPEDSSVKTERVIQRWTVLTGVPHRLDREILEAVLAMKLFLFYTWSYLHASVTNDNKR